MSVRRSLIQRSASWASAAMVVLAVSASAPTARAQDVPAEPTAPQRGYTLQYLLAAVLGGVSVYAVVKSSNRQKKSD